MKTKPHYREISALIVVEVKDVDGRVLTFNTRVIGPMNYNALRKANYGANCVMPTLPQLTPLIHSAVLNREQGYETADRVVQAQKYYRLTGDTTPIWTPRGLWGVDNLVGSFKEKTFLEKLGKREERGVIFSNDGKTRYTPKIYESKFDELPNHETLATHPGVIVIFGGEQQAEQLTEVSAEHELFPYFYGFSQPFSGAIQRAAGLCSGCFSGGLRVLSGYIDDGGPWCSFGVLRDTSEARTHSRK